MNNIFVTMAVVVITIATNARAQTHLGNLSANPYLPKALLYHASTFNTPYDAVGITMKALTTLMAAGGPSLGGKSLIL
jgi:hypothetical protein